MIKQALAVIAVLACLLYGAALAGDYIGRRTVRLLFPGTICNITTSKQYAAEKALDEVVFNQK